MGLDEDKLESLRRWGQALRGASGEEQAASGRAILMLIEEIEGLRLELLRARELASTLQQRVQETVRRDLGSAGSRTTGERAATSPEAWIDSLRRHE